MKCMALLLLAFVSVSCISTQSLLIDIPRSAPKTLPAAIQSLTLVTRAVDEKFSDTPEDTLQRRFYEKEFDVDTVIYDLQMADTTLKALGSLLFESGRYDYVIPQKRFIKVPASASSFEKPMSWKRVKELAAYYETDALLSLDHLKTRVIAGFDYESYYDPFADGFYSAATARMQIYYEALFRVYDPVSEKILVREFLRDTLVWNEAGATAQSLFEQFTPVKQALTEAGISIALEMSELISVIWHTEQRKYFVKGNASMKQARQLVNNGDWDAAVALWQEIAENTGSRSLKSKARYNMAVGYEMLGDVDAAVSQALKSYNTMYRPLTYKYLQILKRRKREIKNQEK